MTTVKIVENEQVGLPWRPYFLHGWPFLSFVEGDEESIAIRALAHDTGPLISYNPAFVSREELEERQRATMWLTPSLVHLCHVLLEEGAVAQDGMGRFRSQDWASFRRAAEVHCLMDWAEIVNAVNREGLDFMSEHVAQCLFCESRLYDRLIDGRPTEIRR